jgi:hypothetical protein
MKRRFAINDAGELVDRDGYVLGRVTSLTLEMGADVEFPQGDYRGLSLRLNSRGWRQLKLVVGVWGRSRSSPIRSMPCGRRTSRSWGRGKKDLDPGGRRVIKDALKVATGVPSDELSACPDRARPASAAAAAGRRRGRP